MTEERMLPEKTDAPVENPEGQHAVMPDLLLLKRFF
jgi:hypothetical protein